MRSAKREVAGTEGVFACAYVSCSVFVHGFSAALACWGDAARPHARRYVLVALLGGRGGVRS